MKNYLFLLFVAIVTMASTTLAESCSSGEGECANPDVVAAEEDPNCPSRDLIIRCAGKHLDANQNGKLDRNELEDAIGSLPWFARGILQILGSVDKMVSREEKLSRAREIDNRYCLEFSSFLSIFCSKIQDEKMRRRWGRRDKHGL